ncbi:cupin domain-containing protein [Halorarius halobius]|uniref:cupin domain-containing protein n=1 Tax=Halorarius halobius TaxID=2962671 RepID=UPI0020CE5214|nr:cupin domain-containing protein [Halorarius halobius]
MERVQLGAETEAISGIHLAQLAAGERVSVQHFRVDPGATVPEHDHHHEQAGFVYEGALTFRTDGEETVVRAGDSYVLAGGEPHAAENRGDVPARGIDVFGPPRPDPDWAE